MKIWGKETFWWRLKNLLCTSRPKQYPERAKHQGTFSAKQQRVSRASFVAKKSSFQNLKVWAFSGVINNTQHSSLLTPNYELTLWFLHVKVPMKVRARPLWVLNWAVWTTHRHQLSLQNTGKHLEHLQNDNPAFGWTLPYLQREQWSAWIKPSEAQLAVWFIILTLSLQHSFSA